MTVREDDDKVEFEDVTITDETLGGAVWVRGIVPLPVSVPKSCIHDDSEIWKAGERGTISIKRWFAEKQGWV